MREVEPARLGALDGWLASETPGPDAILGHVAGTGHGRAWVDRWPAPAVLLVETGGNYLLAGAPAAVEPAAVRPLVRGFLTAPRDFDGVLDEAFPDRVRWDRVVYRFPVDGLPVDGPPAAPDPAGGPVPAGPPPVGPPPTAARLLRGEDTPALERLSDEAGWIGKTWGGPAGLAASGHAYGAFDGARLAAVTCTFFRGERHADAGVVTEPELRGRGLATAAVRAWCAGTLARGLVPTWTTSIDNMASQRLAERLGLTLDRRDVLHVIGIEIPS